MGNILQFLITFLAFTASIYAQSLEFKLLPPKTVRPGELAIQILPVKATKSGLYDIEFVSSKGWNVDGPEKVELVENSVEYITFTTQVPQQASAGAIHELKVTLIDQDGVESSSTLAFTVSQSRDLDFFVPDEQTSTSSRNHRMPLKISNTGNVTEEYELSINNITADIRVSLDQQRISIEPNTTKVVYITINFGSGNGNFSAFEVLANGRSGVRFSKRFQVKLLSHGGDSNQGPRGFGLESELIISNEFINIGSNGTDNGNILYRMQGDLSDYVAMSAYIQAYTLGQAQGDQNFRFDFTGENWRVSMGEYLNNPNHRGLVSQSLSGVEFSYEFLNGLQTGIIIGESEATGDDYIINTSSYEFYPGHKAFLVLGQNLSNSSETQLAAGYQGEFNFKETVTFAPALTISDDPRTGQRINYSQAIKFLVRKNLPIVINSGYLSDSFQNDLYNEVSLHYKSENAIWELSARVEEEERKNASIPNRKRNDLRARVTFPISDSTTAQVAYSQLSDENFTERRPELVFSYHKKRLSANFRGGFINREYNNIEDSNFSNEGWNSFFQSNVSYRKDNFSIIGNMIHEGGDQNGRFNFSVSSYWNPNSNWVDSIFATIGTEQSRFSETTYRRNYVESGVKIGLRRNFNMDLFLRADHNQQTSENEISANVRIYFKNNHSVPESISRRFGGKSTGDVNGRVCIDQNQNGSCEDTEQGVRGIRVTIGLKSIVSDENGIFKFYNMPEGKKYIQIDKSAAATKGYSVLSPSQQITIYRNQFSNVNFPLTRISTLKAFAFLDQDGNGKFESDLESALIGSIATLKKNGAKISEQVINRDFSVVFNQLKDGEYTLEITNNSDDFVATTKQVFDFTLPNDSGQTALTGFKYKIPPEEDKVKNSEIYILVRDNFIFPPDYEVTFDLDYADKNITKILTARIKVNNNWISKSIHDTQTIETISFSLESEKEQIANLDIIPIDYEFIVLEGENKEIKLKGKVTLWPGF